MTGTSWFEAPDGRKGWRSVLAFAIRRAVQNDKLKSLSTLLSILRVNPLFVFHGVMFFRTPSPTTFALLFLGAVAGHLAVNVSSQWKTATVWLSIIPGLLHRYPESAFVQQKVAAYCGEERARDIDRWLVRGLMRGQIDDFVRIFTIQTSVVVENLHAYSSPLFGSFVFVPDPPEMSSAKQRMTVLHEVGHAIDFPAFILELGFGVYAFWLIWIACFVDLRSHPAQFVLSAGLLAFLWAWDVTARRRKWRLHSEIRADRFALDFLTPQEVERLSARKRPPFDSDPELSTVENQIRTNCYFKMLADKGRDPEKLEQEPIGQENFPVFYQIVSICVYGLLATICTPSTLWTIAASVVAATCLSVLFFAACSIQIVSQNAVLESLLPKTAQNSDSKNRESRDPVSLSSDEPAPDPR